MAHLCRSAALTGFADLCRGRGLDPYRMAREAGVPVSALSDPDVKIPPAAVARMLESAARRGAMADFGLRLAETRKLSNMGVVALIAREQPTLRKALEVMALYQWLQNDSVVVHIEQEEGLAVVRLGLLSENGKISRQAVELCVGVLVRNIRFLLGNRWRPQAVCFSHARPRKTDSYLRVLAVTPQFGQDFNGIVFDRREMEWRLVSADPDMAHQIERYVRQLRRSRSAVDEAEELVALLMPTGRCTASAVAKHMGIDRRTLYRKLAAENSSFSAVLVRQRLALAKALMSDPHRSLASVADQIGLASASAFSHWFRRQEGRAPRRPKRRATVPKTSAD